jgi:GT2 family glycosyltransferase
VIAFGCSIVAPHIYDRYAGRGVGRAAELDSVVLAHAASASIARSYNLLLDRAAALDDLEALVIVHQDAEILDADFCTRLRTAFADPSVAIVGCVGAIDVSSIAWWDGKVTWNSAPYRQSDPDREVVFGRRDAGDQWAPSEVETIYGVVIALSPWAVENLRCDESIGMLHGYDFDLCRQARAAGRKVMTADLAVAHHHELGLVSESEVWVAAHTRAAEAWDTSAPGEGAPDIEWKARARAAEANAAAARLLAASRLLELDASVERDGRELDRVRATRSWRLTEPLRRGNAIVRDARRRLKGF